MSLIFSKLITKNNELVIVFPDLAAVFEAVIVLESSAASDFWEVDWPRRRFWTGLWCQTEPGIVCIHKN